MSDSTTVASKKRPAATTRFLIYETSDGGWSLAYRGEFVAHGADEAMRLFFRTLTHDASGMFTAVSENHLRLRLREAAPVVKATVRDIGAPRFSVKDETVVEFVLDPSSTPQLGGISSTSTGIPTNDSSPDGWVGMDREPSAAGVVT